VTVALGEYIARELNVPLDLVPYSSAGALSKSATTGAWDITFMAINPEREKVIKFGAPYRAKWQFVGASLTQSA
jgi:polar amino acid transport system substrate-binding protein